MTTRDSRLGDLLSIGNTSEVWEWSPTSVVKVLHSTIPRHWAEIEADITSKVHAAGLPVPATEALVQVGGRPGIVYERIAGPSMWDQMRSMPGDLPALTERFVNLQNELQACRVDGIPRLRERLHVKIGEAAQLSNTERQEALELLGRLPRGSELCHGDMHPRNVLMAAGGPVVVDWFDAAIGSAVADFARTSLLVAPPTRVAASGAFLDGATHDLLSRIHDAYVRSLAGRGVTRDARFEAWRAVLAAARLAEPVPLADLIAIWRSWRHGPGVEPPPAIPANGSTQVVE